MSLLSCEFLPYAWIDVAILIVCVAAEICRRFRACTHLVSDIYSMRYMTDYGFVHGNRIPLSSSAVLEKKAARKKLLEQVYEKRRLNYQRYIRKLQDNLNKTEIDANFD